MEQYLLTIVWEMRENSDFPHLPVLWPCLWFLMQLLTLKLFISLYQVSLDSAANYRLPNNGLNKLCSSVILAKAHSHLGPALVLRTFLAHLQELCTCLTCRKVAVSCKVLSQLWLILLCLIIVFQRLGKKWESFLASL